MILKNLYAPLIVLLSLGVGTSCSSTTQSKASEINEITGTITYREHMVLTSAAEVEIKLLDVSLADAPAVELASTLLSNPGLLPISFRLEFNPAEIEERNTYVIRADIRDGGRRMFTTDTSYPVLTHGSGAKVDLTLIAMSSNPLSKPDASLTETYWKLIAIYDLPYSAGVNQREAHLKLRADNNAVAGFSGCNNFGGTFTIEEDAINLGPLAMTAMACFEGMDTEQEFVRALDEMDRFEIIGDTMLGLKGDTVILQFEAIYF
jgi:putative lipoprotein